MTPPIAPEPGSSDTRAREQAQELARVFDEALRIDLGTPRLPNPEGWEFRGGRGEFYSSKHVSVVTFARAEKHTLGFILTPTNPNERVYKRSAHFDLVYFSFDVPDDAQHRIFERDRVMIDRVAAWLTVWDNARSK